MAAAVSLKGFGGRLEGSTCCPRPASSLPKASPGGGHKGPVGMGQDVLLVHDLSPSQGTSGGGTPGSVCCPRSQ